MIYYCLTSTQLLAFSFFFFNDTATTEIYTLSLHDALPIYNLQPIFGLTHCDVLPCVISSDLRKRDPVRRFQREPVLRRKGQDRKSTRLNSSHGYISYAVFCLKKKKYTNTTFTYVTQNAEIQ